MLHTRGHCKVEISKTRLKDSGQWHFHIIYGRSIRSQWYYHKATLKIKDPGTNSGRIGKQNNEKDVHSIVGKKHEGRDVDSGNLPTIAMSDPEKVSAYSSKLSSYTSHIFQISAMGDGSESTSLHQGKIIFICHAQKILAK